MLSADSVELIWANYIVPQFYTQVEMVKRERERQENEKERERERETERERE
jgi:hypothetical protein